MFALQSILKRPPLGSDSLCSFSGDKLMPGFKQVTHCSQPPFHSPVQGWQRRDDASVLKRHMAGDMRSSPAESWQTALCLPWKMMARQPDHRGALKASSRWELVSPRGYVCVLMSRPKGSVWNVMAWFIESHTQVKSRVKRLITELTVFKIYNWLILMKLG